MKAEYKQLAFETAIRNPERYKEILNFIKDYDGVLLNDENLLEIVSKMYLEKIVGSKEFDEKELSSGEEIKQRVIHINATRKADGGFPSGYQSRFWTYMRTLSELGFLYARYNEKFILGDIAKRLISDEIDEQEAFSIQAIKYNRKSPYKNVSNDYNYFKFIINVLKRLKQLNKRLSYNQFIISLFSKDGNVDEFIETILNNKFGDKQLTYEYLLNNYPKVNKIKTVMQDYPDVVLRLLRITGFVSIEYKGILLIELNSNSIDYMDKLLNYDFSLTEEEKLNPMLYFKKLQKLTEEQLEIIVSNRRESEIIINYNNTIETIIDSYKLDSKLIIENINGIYNGKTDERFKYISDPLKLEFFIALLMYVTYGKEYNIKPNYKVDSNGMPISHAPGNIGDIEITNEKIYWLLEVTLIRNKIQQQNNETINLFRHINAKAIREKYLSLIAPVIHEDTETLFRSATIDQIANVGLNNFCARPYSIKEFIEITKQKKNIESMNDYTREIIGKLREIIF